MIMGNDEKIYDKCFENYESFFKVNKMNKYDLYGVDYYFWKKRKYQIMGCTNSRA